jgi:O-antigen/teichoic acid export membrane protein
MSVTSLGQGIRAGVKWLLVGSTGRQVLQFAFGIILARLLVPADFGMVVTIQVFTGFVSMVTSGGMGQSLIRAKQANAEEFDVVFTAQLVLGLAIYGIFYACAPSIAHYFDNPLYADLLRVSALMFVIRPFSLIRISWLTRQMDFKKRSLVDIAAAAVTGFCSVAMAFAGMGVWSLVLAGLVGGIAANLLFFSITPLRLRLRLDAEVLRRHGGYGFKVVANDFLTHVKDEALNLILSKLGGAAFLGLFNKAEGLARMPNRLITPPTSQTVFRAMSKVQEDLDQTKYMFYRTVGLLMLYICPVLVGLWWVAEPFIGVVYGEKWLPAAEPMQILLIAALFRPIRAPSGALLAAQNRLTQEIVGQVLGLAFAIVACVIGLRWGLEGVAWGFLASTLFSTAYNYGLVYMTIPTRIADLMRAIAPAVTLSTVLFVYLGLVHYAIAEVGIASPALYLLVMSILGGVGYAVAFFLLPIPVVKSEAKRWREQIGWMLGAVGKVSR